MAKDPRERAKAAAADKDDDAAPKKKGNLKLIIFIVVAMILGGGLGGGGVWYVMDQQANDPKVKKKKKKKKEEPPIYVKFDPPFTANLVRAPGSNSDVYLQASIEFQVSEIKYVEMIKTYTPKMRNDVLLILSKRQKADIESPEGKQKISDEILESVNKTMHVEEKDEGVTAVLFTQLMIQ